MSILLHGLHRNFGIISKDHNIVDLLKPTLNEIDTENYSFALLTSFEESSEFINFDLPDFIVVDLDNSIEDLERIQKLLKEDPWLVGIGVICILGEEKSEDFLQLAHKWNLVALVDRSDQDSLRRAFRIVLMSEHLLMDRRTDFQFQEKPTGQIVISNDVEMAEKTANLVATYLLESGKIDRNKYYNLNMGLSELMINAIEHGNCGISFSDKTKLLEDGVNIMEHIRTLNEDPEIAKRYVTLDYAIEEDRSTWVITDMGEGFDHKEFMKNNPQNLFLPHGRGIMMARNSSDELSYNDLGNQVTLVCHHYSEARSTVPIGFREEEEVLIKEGESVFEEGEESSYLCYILSGEFQVQVGGKEIGSLSPNDMFMGEMSFLLNRKRSATVIAVKDSKILRISQKSFINIIKKYPNYMLLLSRLLAQRLSRANNAESLPFVN